MESAKAVHPDRPAAAITRFHSNVRPRFVVAAVFTGGRSADEDIGSYNSNTIAGMLMSIFERELGDAGFVELA